MDPGNEELLKDFFVEAQMQVELIEQNALELEDNPGDEAAVDEIFRAAHTLKGGSATVQMDELTGFTHKLEDLLDELRKGQISIGENHINVLLSSVDVLKEMLSSRMEGNVYKDDYTSVLQNLELVSNQSSSIQAAPQVTPEKPEKTLLPEKISEYDKLEMMSLVGEDEKVLKIQVYFDESNPMKTVGSIQMIAKLKDVGQILKTVPDFDLLYQENFFPVVDYFVSVNKSDSVPESLFRIPDVTSNIVVQSIEDSIDKSEPSSLKLQSEPQKETKPPETPPVAEKPEAKVEKQPNPSRDNSDGSILRVNSMRIDKLLNLVSESVITKASINQIGIRFQNIIHDLNSNDSTASTRNSAQLSRLLSQLENQAGSGRQTELPREEVQSLFDDLHQNFSNLKTELKSVIDDFRNTSAVLARNTGDLHGAILRIRMVPIRQIFGRFPRLVRDLSKSLNKKIELIVEGENTELDKSVAEELLDPLMHCVRNSMDHGIESADVRRASGKSEQGKLWLKASNEGNKIVIEIEDDGGGIDVEKVKQKAIDRKVIHPNKILSNIEAFDLIFSPGFSTASEITNISGRGVGLDVVRKQIEKLNGSVTVKSTLGEGTAFIIRLPLTMAIIQGLLISVGKEIYAIPVTSVLESHRIKSNEIEILENNEVINVRGTITTLLRLHKLFRIESSVDSEYSNVVIVGNGDTKMGLMVDSLVGEEDVVIKPLKDRYTNAPGIAGATILGDGTVALILDINQLLSITRRPELENGNWEKMSNGSR